jgi:multicomponent Na+:H+ antiporter subunit D
VLGLIPSAVPAVERAAARFLDHGAYARWVLHGLAVKWPTVTPSHETAVDVLYAVLAVSGAVACAAIGLFGRSLREALPAGIRDPSRSVLRGLRRLHSGHIGDTIAWWSTGAAALGLLCLVSLR